MTLTERAEKAAEMKRSGRYNCCQAVTVALADETGMDEETLNSVAAGFCVGMGNMQATCGSLIGAGMIAGLKTNGNGTVRFTRQISEAFVKKCGAITCKDLKAIVDGKPLCPCENCVRNAVLSYGEVMGIE